MSSALQEGRWFVRGRSRLFFCHVEGGYVKWIIFVHREREVKVFWDKRFYILYSFFDY